MGWVSIGRPPVTDRFGLLRVALAAHFPKPLNRTTQSAQR
jgi:hypothetical protein